MSYVQGVKKIAPISSSCANLLCFFGLSRRFHRCILLQRRPFGVRYGMDFSDRRQMGKAFAIIWVIWLHWNEVVFKGRMASTNGICLAF